MPEDEDTGFDPYLKWLGIPPKDQPPHHYRLLGIELFESDPEVISNAADGRMLLIRSFQAGSKSRVTQKILNELAVVRVCLLDPNKKATYDHALRSQLQALEATPSLRQPPALPTRSNRPPLVAGGLATGQPISNESFDPYHAWLGIGVHEQPAHHYRLLGVQPFESDPSVIATAAMHRMVEVKTFETGEHGGLSHRILKELAAARNCLLAPESKADYDRRLEASLGNQVAAPTVAPQVGVPSQKPKRASGLWAKAKVTRDNPSTRRFARSDAKARSQFIGIVLGGIAGTLMAVGILYMIRGRGPSTAEGPVLPVEREDVVAPRNAAPFVPLPAVPDERDSDEPDSDEDVPNVELETAREFYETWVQPVPENSRLPVSDLSARNDAEVPDADGPSADEMAESGSEKTPQEDSSLEPEPVEPDDSPRAKKLAVPSDTEREAAEKQIRSDFRSEFARAKTIEQKLSLANRLFQLGLETEDGPAMQYVLLRVAADMVNDLGGLHWAFTAVEEIAARYDVKPSEIKAELLTEAIELTQRAPGLSVANLDLVEQALGLARQAAFRDEYEAADRLLTLASRAARKTKDRQLLREVLDRTNAIEQASKEYEKVQTALALLAVDPADGDANLRVGGWYCLMKGEWEKGLPYLVKGSDPDLAGLAARDLAEPDDSGGQLAVGKGWWEQAEREEALFGRAQLYSRAGRWFELALPRLTGVVGATTQQRLEQITWVPLAIAPEEHTAVEPGNVALATNGTTTSGSASPGTNMIDGVIPSVVGSSGIALGNWPCQWTVTFDKVYLLREIRLKIPEGNGSYQHYVVTTSVDGRTFVPLRDHSKTPSFGWQRILFLSRPVKAITLQGLFHSLDSTFYATELEAYCATPTSVIEAAEPAEGEDAGEAGPVPSEPR